MLTFKNEQMLVVQPISSKPRQKYVPYHEHNQYERAYVMKYLMIEGTTC